MCAFQQAIFGGCAASEAHFIALDSDLRDEKDYLRSRRTALATVRREILRRLYESVSVFAGSSASGDVRLTYMKDLETGTHARSIAGAEAYHGKPESPHR